MFVTNDRNQPNLTEAAQPLLQAPAPAVRDPNSVPMPTTRFLADHALCRHITQSDKGLVFLPDKDDFNTHAILVAAREAWSREDRPVLAVCAFSKSPLPLAKATGIQCDTVDQFLSDLQFAHRLATKPGEQPSYLIRHVHSPTDTYDDVLLPAHANLVVYQPHALSPKQLATIFEHVANVRGKVILCGDPELFSEYHPQLADHVKEALAKWVAPKLERDNTRRSPTSESPTTPQSWDRAVLPARPRPLEHSPLRAIVRQGVGGDRQPLLPGVSPAEEFNDTPGSYLVYHSRGANLTQFPGHYRLVAKVEARSMKQALARTQHIGGPWTDNRGVTAYTQKPRSTQAGDVIVEEGRPFRFDGAGFNPIQAKFELEKPQRQQHHQWRPQREPEPPSPDPADDATKPKRTHTPKP